MARTTRKTRRNVKSNRKRRFSGRRRTTKARKTNRKTRRKVSFKNRRTGNFKFKAFKRKFRKTRKSRRSFSFKRAYRRAA